MVKRIHARLNAEGITINYPARRLFLATEDTDGFERFSERSSEGGGGPGSLPLA
jgi:hypothetical protein